jgi:hypothetical protein
MAHAVPSPRNRSTGPRGRVPAAVLVLAVALALAGCGSSSSPPASSPGSAAATSSPPASPSPSATVADVAGTWTGPWVRVTSPAGKGQYTLTVQQSGAELTGTLTATGSACLATNPVSGHVLGSLVNFHTTQGPGTGDFSGTLTQGGATLTGTAVVTCSAGVGRASFRLVKS